MWILWLLLLLVIAFCGGVATSFAEYKFSFSLYETVRDKIFRKKTGAPGAR